MIKIDKTTNYEHKSAHRSSSELAPASWLDDLETALLHVQSVIPRIDWRDNWTARAETEIAEKCLKTAIASERSRSSNGGSDRSETAK